jgi:hypothetical protein
VTHAERAINRTPLPGDREVDSTGRLSRARSAFTAQPTNSVLSKMKTHVCPSSVVTVVVMRPSKYVGAVSDDRPVIGLGTVLMVDPLWGLQHRMS